jgi:hypothetical protein
MQLATITMNDSAYGAISSSESWWSKSCSRYFVGRPFYFVQSKSNLVSSRFVLLYCQVPKRRHLLRVRGRLYVLVEYLCSHLNRYGSIVPMQVCGPSLCTFGKCLSISYVARLSFTIYPRAE